MIPTEIVNKILFYTLTDSIFTSDCERHETLTFGNNKLSPTKTLQYIVIYKTHNRVRVKVPLKIDNISKKTTSENYTIPHSQFVETIGLSKVIHTYITPEILDNTVKNVDRLINDTEQQIIASEADFDITEALKIEYRNITELYNYLNGMYLRTVDTIYIHYPPYNNGIERKYAISREIRIANISNSPLQMLWKIRNGDIKIKELKKLATVNKIVGRSKLKTRLDFINAFMIL
jgi:hypothetical protein|tara:strand:- start:349 stop:1047 length:699 start_codon:yes stop_codon:yes gene_type:complete